MKKLSRASIKRILETKTGGNREGGLITEDNAYVTNGTFFIPNTLNFNGDLKLDEMKKGMFTNIFVNRLLTLLDKCTKEYKFVKEEDSSEYGILCEYSDSKKSIYVIKKYVQVIHQIMCSTLKFEDVPILVQPYFDFALTKGSDTHVLNFLGCGIMPVIHHEKVEV